MGLQKYRADVADAPKKNGSVMWRSKWMGGPSPALIRNCPTMFGPRTVYIKGEPDTYFSIPAACKVQGRTVHGYVLHGKDGWTFHVELWRYVNWEN